MAGDGEADFTTLISPPGTAKLPDATVIRNSILVQSMLVQEALNISSMRWRAIVYEFLSQIRIFLETHDPQFQETFYKIVQAWQPFDLCEPLPPIDRP
jgi:hypothetical protein